MINVIMCQCDNVSMSYSQSEMNCEKSFVMLSAYFLRKIHSIMTNCKFVIGNEVKHLGCAHVDVYEILHVRSLR